MRNQDTNLREQQMYAVGASATGLNPPPSGCVRGRSQRGRGLRSNPYGFIWYYRSGGTHRTWRVK
eukprot:4932855-Prymnesium_polylepis.2